MFNNKNLSKIIIIGSTTFKEIIKSRILINTALLGLLLLLVTFVAYSFTYGEPSRVALDIGLGMLSISSVGIAIFIGVSLLSKEIESRTVYMIISRPVPRFVFIIGKLLGLSLVLIVNIIILSVITLSLYFFIGGSYLPLISWNILFIMMEAILVLFTVSFLSLMTSQTISVIITMLLYVLGHSIESAKEASFSKLTPLVNNLLDLYHFILPGFYKLNIKGFVLYKQSLPTEYLCSTLFYSITYSMFLLFASIYVFNKKNLD